MSALLLNRSTEKQGPGRHLAMDRRERLMGYLLVLLGSTLFASKAIFIKLAYRELPDAMVMLVWRMIFALPFFAATWLYAARRSRPAQAGQKWGRSVISAILAGLVGYYLAMIFDFMGLLYVSAQLERLALFTYPIFVMFLGAMIFGERLTPGNVVSALMAYLGLAVIFLSDLSATGSAIWLGTAFVLASALAFAIYQLWAKELITVMGSLLFTSIALTSASITSIAHFFIARGAPPIESPSFMALAVATAVIATVIPSYLVNAGMSRIGAQSTAMISTISPLFTIGLAVMVLNEKFQLTEALGTALVVGGIGNHTLRDLRELHTRSA